MGCLWHYCEYMWIYATYIPHDIFHDWGLIHVNIISHSFSICIHNDQSYSIVDGYSPSYILIFISSTIYRIWLILLVILFRSNFSIYREHNTFILSSKNIIYHILNHRNIMNCQCYIISLIHDIKIKSSYISYFIVEYYIPYLSWYTYNYQCYSWIIWVDIILNHRNIMKKNHELSMLYY
jgi:hypothetical protein